MPTDQPLIANLLGLLPLLSIGAVSAWTLMVVMTARRLARPPRRGYGSQLARNLPGDPSELPDPLVFEQWTLADGSPVWDITGKSPTGPVIIFTHGWGHARHNILERIESVSSIASRVLAWDLPGHGESPLRRCLLGASEHEQLSELIDKAKAENPSGIVLWGWSMGAGISIESALERDVSGVIAESAYAVPVTPARNVLSLARLPHRFTLLPALWLLGSRRSKGISWNGFDRVDLASRIGCPLLVLHGSEDEVSPIEDGRAIASSTPAATLREIQGGHHRDLWREPFRSQAQSAVEQFLTEQLSTSTITP